MVTYHKKYVTHLLKLKNDFHSFIAAIHPLTLLSLFEIRQGMNISFGNEYKQAKEIVEEGALD